MWHLCRNRRHHILTTGNPVTGNTNVDGVRWSISEQQCPLFLSQTFICRLSFDETQDGDDNGALWVAFRVVSTSLPVMNNLRKQPYTSCQALYDAWLCVVGRVQQSEHLLLRRREATQANEIIHHQHFKSEWEWSEKLRLILFGGFKGVWSGSNNEHEVLFKMFWLLYCCVLLL